MFHAEKCWHYLYVHFSLGCDEHFNFLFLALEILVLEEEKDQQTTATRKVVQVGLIYFNFDCFSTAFSDSSLRAEAIALNADNGTRPCFLQG